MDQDFASLVLWLLGGLGTIITLLLAVITHMMRQDKIQNDSHRVVTDKRLKKHDKKHVKHDRKFVEVQQEIKSLVMVMDNKKRGRG